MKFKWNNCELYNLLNGKNTELLWETFDEIISGKPQVVKNI